MTARLADRVAIVFGAGQTPGATIGNGRACAIRYAQEGAAVACVDRDLASAQETASLITTAGGRALALHADVTREADCSAAIDACVSAFGPIDILHNNVGAAPGDTLDVATLEDAAIDAVVALNFKSVIFTCKHVLPAMRERRTGCIVNISSIVALFSAGPVLYKTTKYALNSLTQHMAMSYAEYGVRVNAIMPGYIETPVSVEGLANRRNIPLDDVRRARDAQVPLRHKMGSAWDVANAALFLASDDASFITGVILPVDGGHSVRVG